MMEFDMVRSHDFFSTCLDGFWFVLLTPHPSLGYRSPEEPATVKDMYTKNRTEAFGPEVQRRIMLGSFVLSRKYALKSLFSF
jgi:Asp-tRNA(Asn)/Glu-tRNA(Gln) amidotransferase A subunit family amidase